MPLLALVLAPALASAQFPTLTPDAPFDDLRRTVPVLSDVRWIDLVDLDGDGAPELIRSGTTATQVLANDGNGGLRAPEAYCLAFGCPHPLPPFGPVVGADLDGDGAMDVVAAGEPFFGDGSGRLASAPGPLSGLTSLIDAVVLDVEGDGDPDVVLADFARTYLLRNEGARVLVDASASLPAGGSSFGLAVLDVEPDGDADLVRDGVLLRNDGAGGFTLDPAALPGPPVGPWLGLRVADADGDGDDDLLASDLAGGLYLLRNRGAAGFAVERLAADFPPVWSVGDLDGDGDPDVVAQVPPSVLVNDGAGGFAPGGGALPSFAPRASLQELVADLDRDGDLDVLGLPVPGHGGDVPVALRLWLGDGQGSFLEAQRHVPTERWLPLALADLDGDGDPDVVGRPAASGTAEYARRNDGTGVLAPAGELFPGLAGRLDGTSDVAAADVDGDGDLDLLWSGPVLLVNEGASGFVDRTAELLPALGPGRFDAVVLADLDGDGDADAFLARESNAFGTQDVLLANDGSGRFTDASALLPATSALPTHEVAQGDVDGDGSLDLLLAEAGPNTLLLGDGAGGFVDASDRLPGPGWLSYDVALADLDGDGALDAYVANASSPGGPSYEGGHGPASNQVLLNRDGRFVEPLEPHRTFDVGLEVELADVDADGDVDALVGTATYYAASMLRGGETTLYRNDGAGNLRRDDSFQGLLDEQIVAGDLDLDGDIDVILPERVLSGVRRQLSWTTLPRVGKRTELELRGPAGAPFLLLFGQRGVAVPTDGGLLRIDPDAIGSLVQGVLGPRGRRTVPWVPSASLLGSAIHAQAALLGPVGYELTNLEPLTPVAF